MSKPKTSFEGDIKNIPPEIYLSIDHLKNGTYKFHFIQKDKVIKTIHINKK